jgi:CubicO group peptidase (beta-lactamase class C family)
VVISNEKSKKSRVGRSLAIAMAMLAVLLAVSVIFQSKLRTIGDLYAESGLAGVYYQAKDVWPWASPNVNWDSADPASQGVDSNEIEKIWTRLSAADTRAFLVVRNNHIIAEKYGPDYGPNRPIGTSAVGKTITAAMLVGLAIDDGLIKLDDKMYEYLAQWQDDDAKSAIKIRHVVTHTSGLDDVSFGSSDLTGWKQYYYDNPGERFHLAINVAPVKFKPGSQFEYSGLGFYALGYVLAKRFHGTAEPDLERLLDSRIMGPLGIPKHDWNISYGESHHIDGMTLYAIGSGGAYTPRAIARIGQLLLNSGEWNEYQLLASSFVKEMMAYGGLSPKPQFNKNHPAPGGIGIWSNCDGYWPSLPRDAVLGLGGSHNFLLVVPSLDLVVVRMGGLLPRINEEQAHWQVLESAVFADLSEAVGALEPLATPVGCGVR